MKLGLPSRKIKKGDNSILKTPLRMKNQLKLVKGILYRKTLLETSAEKMPRLQIILLSHLSRKALYGCHDQVGHKGIFRTLSLLRWRFYWPGMHKEYTLYVNKCQRC